MVEVQILNKDWSIRSKKKYKKQCGITQKFRDFILNKAYIKPTIIIFKCGYTIEEVDINVWYDQREDLEVSVAQLWEKWDR